MLSIDIPQKCALALFSCLWFLSLLPWAAAMTSLELLEKAIYTEETVGDLQQAIQIYEKVLAESKTSLRTAAQAQFRIGTCYAKQGQTQEAATAFQAVVDNYPPATSWVARAKSRLASDLELLPVPWGDGDELHLEMNLLTGLGVGHQVFRVAKLEQDGRALWECSNWQTVTLNGARGKSRVLADLQTFAPVQSYWKHNLLGESRATYGTDQVVIEMASKEEPITLEFEGPVFDNEQAAEMFRRLPLKIGYKTKVDIIPILNGAKIALPLHVSELKTIEVPAGKFECFRLELGVVNQTFWISNDEHRYLVRFEAGGLVANLTEVRTYRPHQTTRLQRERFTATLPPDWFAYTPAQLAHQETTKTRLIDPEAAMEAWVKASPLPSIRRKNDSPRGWLESILEEHRQRLQDFSLVDPGIVAITVGDREGAAAVFEYLAGDQRQTTRRIALFGDDAAVNLQFTTLSDDYEQWQSAVAEILTSLQVN